LTTLYQAGNGIFDLYDKILVLDDGHQIYYGPRALAKQYFEDIGFVCPAGANVADFLTSVSVPTERQIKHGFESVVPNSAKELENVYLASPIAQMMQQNIMPKSSFRDDTVMVHSAYRDEQPKYKSPLQSSYKVGLYHQTLSCITRYGLRSMLSNMFFTTVLTTGSFSQSQIIIGDKYSLIMQQVSALIYALISGSLYYNLPQNSSGTFTRKQTLGVIRYNAKSCRCWSLVLSNCCIQRKQGSLSSPSFFSSILLTC
jgi:ATP-binding cassette subfamily G (WHITE) protein 2 (SNQ2)